MTESAKPVPKSKNNNLVCSCPKSDNGEWLRDAEGYFVTDEKCKIHGGRKSWKDTNERRRK